jgi:hypothetical protein
LKRPNRLVALATVLLNGACFSYQPSQLESIAPGKAVRLRISPEEADRLADAGLSDSRLVDGVLVENGAAGVVLDTRIGINDPTRGTRALTQRINVAQTEIREVELRQLDRLKTGLVAGAFAVVVGAVVAAQLVGGRGRADDPGPGPDELRVPPGFRINVPIF